MRDLGNFKLTVVSDGGFRLDGGAMFGVVPRVLWERPCPPDEHNRIRMATNCLLVERGSDLLLIDTGIGDKHDPKFQANYGMEPGAVRLPDSIRRAGYELEDVTHVLLSHLHFDHCGWSTRHSGDRIVPTFSNARYWLQRGEVEHARNPNERDRASYDPRNWEPLFEAGVAELFGDEAEPIPGVKAVRTPGHNADMCIVLIDGGGGERAVYWADLVPTSAHVPYPWIMSYDLYPLTTLENKKIWLPRAAEGNWLCVFEHDPDVPFARLVEEKPGRFKAVPESVLATA
ncbi:MAG TPA: MBL fold metallo-hydrolase [Thermoanaerobaculia bacterium]|nr:MBL fold metallo-hydrolase [Thermoanaerobaculia bacterium]